MLPEESSQDTGTETNNPVSDEQHISDEHVDYKALYQAEVQNSKKQRAAKQKYESEWPTLTTTAKADEEKRLVEQNKYKELWEKDKSEAEWARTYKADRHAKLLERLPEDKREKFSNLDLNSLEAVVDELATKPKEVVKAVHGQIDSPKMDKPWKDMNDKERRAYHDSLMSK